MFDGRYGQGLDVLGSIIGSENYLPVRAGT